MMEYFIFLPGIMGSELRVPADAPQYAGEEVWPPNQYEAVFGYGRIHLLEIVDLDPTDIIGKVWPCTYYSDILRDLDRVAQARTADSTKTNAEVVEFPYDWRLDLFDTAGRLADVLDGLAADEPDAVFSVIAHSMGGLVARCALESPSFTKRPFRADGRLKRLVTIGTPHKGAPLALERILGLSKAATVSKEDFKEFSKKTAFPAGYQLLPPEGSRFVRDITNGQATSAPLDIFDPPTVSRLGLVKSLLDKNQEFRAHLDLDRAPCDYVFFAGGVKDTTTGLEVNGSVPSKVVDGGAGDETVPSFSAGDARVNTRYFKSSHVGLLSHLRARNHLFELLDAPRTLRPVSATEAVSGDALVEDISGPVEPVRARSEDPASVVAITVNLREPVDAFEDTIVFEPITEASDAIKDARRESHGLSYQGAPLDSFTVVVPAPKSPGGFQILLRRQETDDPSPPFFIADSDRENAR